MTSKQLSQRTDWVRLYLDDETVELRLEEIFILEMFVCYGEQHLQLARLEGPAQHDVEPGPAVLQQVGDGPLVAPPAPATVGHERDVSVTFHLHQRGE